MYCLPAIIFLFAGYQTQAQTIPAYRTTDWTKAGLQDSVPSYNTVVDVMNFGADNTGATPSDAALQTAIASLNGTPGVIYFPTGTYQFNQTVDMRDSLVLTGNGKDKSRLIFNLGHGFSNMFDFHGTIGSTVWDVAQPIEKDSNKIELNNTTGINTGDWLQLYGNDVALTTSAWAAGTVGQIVQVAAIKNNTITTVQKIRRSYDMGYAGKLKKITPIRGAGLECMYIQRFDSTIQQTNNIDFDKAVNCWVIGVESDSTNFCHIAMSNSAHLLARGNYFHHAHAYGGGGQGYGVNIQYTSGDCVVENNIFEHLRHAMLVQAGANGNVFAYNYSTDPYWDEPPFPTNSAGDIVCHGNYAFLNLFEGNIVQNIVIDDSHGINGPFNTLFRNRAQGYGIFMNNTYVTDSMNIVGNEVTNNSGFYTLQGAGHFEYGNNIKGTITPPGAITLPENYLHYTNTPGYWHLTTGFSTIGLPYPYNKSNIPAVAYYQQRTDCRRNPVLAGDYVPTIHNASGFLSAYPNPGNGIITFRYKTQESSGLSITVYDMTGRLITQIPLATASGIAHWDSRNAPAGIYLYQLRSNEGILQTGKLVVAQ